MDEYEKQANEFLKKTETSFKAEFLKHDYYFENEKDKRDIYLITLKRGEREYKFKFGNSIYHSLKFKIIKGYLNESIKEKLKQKGFNEDGINTREELNKIKSLFFGQGQFWNENKNFKEPSSYDVLACLTKYNPEDFKFFCDNYGYDEDSRKAEKIYNNVIEEWKNVCMLWNEEELNLLREIN